MSRFEMVACDFVFPDGDTCGLRSAVRLAQGWQLGGPDLCPRHRTDRTPGGGQPVPIRRAA